MSRFNIQESTKTKNLAGGLSFEQSPELELVSILLTSFAKDKFYKSANEEFETLKRLISICDPEFVAKAAVYARTKFGMRSITHVVASELAKHISGKAYAKAFYKAIIYRPDDMMEIISYHVAKNGKLTNAMKDGFALAFDKFDAYKLAKYRGEGKGFKLVDVVNMVHPVPVEGNAKAIESLVKGELKSFDTWEVELSKSGSDKKEVWVKLIQENKLGYFALLKNLRNIIEQAPEILGVALEQLTMESLIKKSLVLPFRFLTAYEQIQNIAGGKESREVLMALNKAVDISVNNVPKFEGETLVVLDESGSMTGKPATIGSLFSAVLIKSNNADFITFSDLARYRNVNPQDSTLTISQSIKFASGGTNFHSIFQTANKKYDRIIILSDMQGWIGHDTPMKEFNEWKRRTNSNPFVYSFDLAGYGSMQFPEKNVFCLAGFSEKIFDIMSFLERDKNALINEIKKTEF